MKRIAILLAVVALGMCCLAGVSLAKDKVIVATDTNFKPFSFKNSEGVYTGFDVEFWAAIAKEMNIEYTLQPMDFNGIIPGLQSGNVDVAVAGMSVKSKREEVIDFAFPYYKAGLVIMVKADNQDIMSIEDFPGKIVATKQGTSTVDFLNSGGWTSKLKELKKFPNISDAFMELAAGGCDAVFFDLPPLADYANNTGKGKVVLRDPLYMGHYYGIATPAGSALRDDISIGILRLMENGTYADIYQKWFFSAPK
jgi:glutamine transport system substrate-binding protein